MSAELGGSQISSLLEALPGIASVLRSPVADALVKAIRAAAGVGEFAMDDAEELVRYAVRRGLIGPEEGDRVLADIEVPLKSKVKPVRAARPKPLVRKRSPRRSRGGEAAAPASAAGRRRRVRSRTAARGSHARRRSRAHEPGAAATPEPHHPVSTRGGPRRRRTLRHRERGRARGARARARQRARAAGARRVPGAGGSLRRS